MNGLFRRMLPYLLVFFGSGSIMVLELVASRMVARHVGSSLSVWTSVIGVILAGICLGNVLGGKLADRFRPRGAVGPLFALGAAFTLVTLWMNSAVIPQLGALESLAWEWRAVAVVVIDFLIPSTILGMIGPVVAKLAVEEADPARAGSAMGRVYAMGNLGSIVGTLLAGYVLMYYAQTSSIVSIVAAALALPAALLMGGWFSALFGLLAVGLLGVGVSFPLMQLAGKNYNVMPVAIGDWSLNAVLLAGHGATLLLALVGLAKLFAARVPSAERALADDDLARVEAMKGGKVRLGDLAALSFVASIAFMAFEMDAGRLVQRHLGSSIYGWTSVISVMLAGLSIGNYLGGKIGDRIRSEAGASWLLLVTSVAVLGVLLLESPPAWLAGKILPWIQGRPYISGGPNSVLHAALEMHNFPFTEVPAPWPARILLIVSLVFLIPCILMGTISPVCAKLAIDRFRVAGRTGAAIGNVYAWGMVGALVGTFLTGFYLIDWLGTKGMLLAIAAVLAIWGTVLGNTLHAIWAGIPIGLSLIAFIPAQFLEKQAVNWGIKEPKGDPETKEEGALAYVDESPYYYIKVTNTNTNGGDQYRTLVLDNLIHGYYILDHPEHLGYDYEWIYSQVTHRAALRKAKERGLITEEQLAKLGKPASGAATEEEHEAFAKEIQPKLAGLEGMNALFLGGGAYTIPRYLRNIYPQLGCDVAEIDPAVTRANRASLGLLDQLSESPDSKIATTWGDARQFVEKGQGGKKYDVIFGDAFNDFSVPWHLTTREFNRKLSSMLTDDGIYMINIIDRYHSDAKAERDAVEGRLVKDAEDWAKGQGWSKAELDIAKAAAGSLYLVATDRALDRQKGEGAPGDSPAPGGADALVAELRANAKDAEGRTLADEVKALVLAKLEDQAGPEEEELFDPAKVEEVGKSIVGAADYLVSRADSYAEELPKVKAEALRKARELGGFLSAWVKTAGEPDSFPHISVFGTFSNPGSGLRETFVVVASKQPVDLADLGRRPGDPQFSQHGSAFHPSPYAEEAMKELDVRSRGIILTDDYAPVDNLLAPTAASRGEKD